MVGATVVSVVAFLKIPSWEAVTEANPQDKFRLFVPPSDDYLFILILLGLMATLLYPNLKNPDLVFPTLAFDLLPIGLRRLMLASIAAALLSTFEAMLNSSSTLLTMDFVNTFRPNTTAPSKEEVENHTWRREFWQEETEELDEKPWYKNHRYLTAGLVAITIPLLIWWR